MRVIGYTRVSNQEQAVDGLSLDTQRAAIVSECARRGWTLAEVIEDDGYTATKEDRPGYQRVLSIMDRRRSKARPDAVVVARLDRLTRSVQTLSGFIDKASARRFGVVALDMDLNTKTANGKMVMQVVGVVAEWESTMISERVTTGMLAAHAEHRAKGEPFGFTRKVNDATVSRIVRARKRGQSWSAIARRLDADAVPTPDDGQRWYSSTVSRIFNRATESSAAA